MTEQSAPEPGEPQVGDVSESEPSTPLVEDPAPSEPIGEQEAEQATPDASEQFADSGADTSGIGESPAEPDADATLDPGVVNDTDGGEGDVSDPGPEPELPEGETVDDEEPSESGIEGEQVQPDDEVQPEHGGGPEEFYSDAPTGDEEVEVEEIDVVVIEEEHPDDPSKLREALAGPTHDDLNPLYASENPEVSATSVADAGTAEGDDEPASFEDEKQDDTED